MSFWPRFRKRGGPRKRSGKQNPYSVRDVEKYEVVHSEFEAQRAQFAAEKGVPISFVRFISRSSRGWVYLSDPLSPPRDPRASAAASPSLSRSSSFSGDFSLPPASIALPNPRPSASTSSGDGGNAVGDPQVAGEGAQRQPVGEEWEDEEEQGSRNAVRTLMVKLQDEKRVISKTAAVLFVKVSVFSRALGASTAIAFTIAVVVNSWSRGKNAFQRVFSALATQLLTSLRPHLSALQNQKESLTLLLGAPSSSPSPLAAAASFIPNQSKLPSGSSASTKPAGPSGGTEPEMKVISVTERLADSGELRSSSFAFPVLTRDSSTASISPLFPVSTHVPAATGRSLSEDAAVSAVASSSPPCQTEDATVRSAATRMSKGEEEQKEKKRVDVAPLMESNKISHPTRPCQRLRSKLFKSSPGRKVTPASSGENSSPPPESEVVSPRVSKKASFIQRRKSSKLSREELPFPPPASVAAPAVAEARTSTSEESDQTTRRGTPSKAHEVSSPFFCSSPTSNAKLESSPESVGKKNVSRSHELKYALKSLGKKKGYKSQELVSSSSPQFSSSPSPPRSPEFEDFQARAGSLSPAAEIVGSSGKKKTPSRSHELKFTLKSLGKKKGCKSHELVSPASPSRSPPQLGELRELTIPTSTAEGLQALAFPFREEASSPPSRSLPKSPKKRNTLGRMLSLEKSKEEKDVAPPLSPRMKNFKASPKREKGAASSQTSSPLVEVDNFKPKLSRVRTSLTKLPSAPEAQLSELRRPKTSMANTGRNTPLPSQSGELGRSQVISREILGSLLLLAVLGFLLLGRIPAILATACFCMILSSGQRFFNRHLTPKDKEILRRNSGIRGYASGGPGYSGYSSSNHSAGGSGSPLNDRDYQSSDYRKRVLMEGLLERGNRRGAP